MKSWKTCGGERAREKERHGGGEKNCWGGEGRRSPFSTSTYPPAGDEVELLVTTELLQRRDDVIAALLEVDAPGSGLLGVDGGGLELALVAMGALERLLQHHLPPGKLLPLPRSLEELHPVGAEEVAEALDGGLVPGGLQDVIVVGHRSRVLGVAREEGLHAVADRGEDLRPVLLLSVHQRRNIFGNVVEVEVVGGGDGGDAVEGDEALGEGVVEATLPDDDVGREDDGGDGGSEGGAEVEAGLGARPVLLVRRGGVDDGLLGQVGAGGSRSRRRGGGG